MKSYSNTELAEDFVDKSQDMRKKMRKKEA
jgi:hypothetical protein